MSTARVRLTTLWIWQYDTVSKMTIIWDVLKVLLECLFYTCWQRQCHTRFKSQTYSTVCFTRTDSNVNAHQELNQRVRDYSRGCSCERTTDRIDAMSERASVHHHNYKALVSRQKLKLEQAQTIDTSHGTWLQWVLPEYVLRRSGYDSMILCLKWQ
jgi:hypothetical protein